MNKKLFYLIILVSIVLVLSYLWLRNELNSGDLQVVFFDVGQGDAHFIRTPGEQNILIDGGPDKTVLEKLARYMPVNDRTIDLMILTHPHADHVAGLVEVLRRYRVERVLGTGALHTTDEYLNWLSLIKEQGIIFDQAIAPKQYIFANEDGGISLDVLYPDRDVAGEKFDDLNESSVTVRLAYKNQRFLFTGDITVDVEKRIINSGVSLKADVLKVAHQGSDTSTSPEWLEAVQPDFAVVPVGKNDFGHPSLTVIRRLERAGAKVLRTDQAGDIRFTVDKNGVLKLN